MRMGVHHRRGDWSKGVTLMEIMIVVFVMALIMTGMALGIGNLTHQRLKSSGLRVAAGVRTAYSRAATTGHTVRIVFDIDNDSLWIEEAEAGRVLLDREDEEAAEDATADEEIEEGEEGSGEGIGPLPPGGSLAQAQDLSSVLGADPDQLLDAARGAAQADMSKSLDFDLMGQLGSAGIAAAADIPTPRYTRPRFGPVPGKRGQVAKLHKGVSIISVYTSHREHPAEEGKAFLYFFPGGFTELAVIQLQDSAGHINSVEVHPLTGRCYIHNVPYEAPTRIEDRNEAAEAL